MNETIRMRIELSEVICKKIKPLCEPLAHVFGIPTFGYRKFFPDGTCFNTSTNFEWTKFVQEKFANAFLPNYDEEVSSALRSEKHYVLRIGEPDRQDVCLSALYDHDIWNTLSLYRNNGTSVEGFYFTSTKNNYKIVDEYVNNIELFERFTLYFKEKFSAILSEEEVKKASFSTVSPFVFEENNPKTLDEEKYIQELISDIPIHKLFLNIHGKEVHLSMQEFKCLAWISRGKTAKEVARIMDLSPRTVESYMDNVKFKTKIESRSKLIDLFVLNFYKDKRLF